MTNWRGRAGFTLVELIMVIVIIGVVAAMVGAFIRLPVQGYVDLGRRAALVDSAEGALRRMARDIRLAVPNSVRIATVGAGFALEVLPTFDGGRYATAGVANQVLDFSASDTDFDINGVFQRIAPSTTTAHRLVINNLGTAGNNNVYTAAGAQSVITPAGTSITYSVAAGGVHHVAIAGGYQFASGSPRQRLFVVNGAEAPISYLCDPAAGTLTRYAGYAVAAAQPTTAAALAGATSIGRVADFVSTCGAISSTTNIQERGLVTLDLGLADQGESVRLIHQVQLDNSR